MSTPYVRFWYAITVAFVAVLVVSFAGVAYTNYVQKQAERRAELARQDSDRRWCGLFAALDPPGTPPTNERGKVIAEEIHRLRVSFGCPER